MNRDLMSGKIKGALYGVAVGDALGAPLEFMSAEQIKCRHGRVTEMIGGGWLSVQPGEVTDDTQMTLAVAEGVVANPDNPIEEIGERFIAWAHSGPKDIGVTCSQSIHGAAAGRTRRPTEGEWFKASKSTAEANGKRSGGNGALMRTVYPGLYYQGELMAVETAVAIAQMTHWDDESNEACEFYTRIIHFITEGTTFNIYEVFKETSYHEILTDRAAINRLEPSGYVVDSMKCALAAFWHTERFDDAVTFAANLGGDADTIAAIAGGLAGAFYGYNAIPQEWVESLAPDIKERLDALADAAVINRTAKQGGKS